MLSITNYSEPNKTTRMSSSKTPERDTTSGPVTKKDKQCVYHTEIKSILPRYYEIYTIIKDFYNSFGFRWCCGLEDGKISLNTSTVFKTEFMKVFSKLQRKINISTGKAKRIFSNFTNSKMFERIYYRTNPETSSSTRPDESSSFKYDSSDIYGGINQQEHSEFIDSFWEAIRSACDIHSVNVKKEHDHIMTAIKNMTR